MKEKTENDVPAAPKRKKRLLLRIGLITLAVVLAVLIAAVLLLDRIIVGAVRTIGPQVTGTRVELTAVRTALLRGQVDIHGFKVGNPSGFREPDIFVLDQFVCRVRPGSIFTDRIVVEEVTIDGMLVNYELKMNGESNLGAIQRNIESFAGKDKAAAKPEQPEPAADEPAPKPAKAGKQVLIQKVVVKNVKLALSSDLFGSTVTLPLPDITLNNLGDGRTMAETISAFMTELMRETTKAVSGELSKHVGQLNEAAQKAFGEAGEQGKKALEGLGEGGKEALDKVGEEGKKALEQLKGIFN